MIRFYNNKRLFQMIHMLPFFDRSQIFCKKGSCRVFIFVKNHVFIMYHIKTEPNADVYLAVQFSASSSFFLVNTRFITHTQKNTHTVNPLQQKLLQVKLVKCQSTLEVIYINTFQSFSCEKRKSIFRFLPLAFEIC